MNFRDWWAKLTTGVKFAIVTAASLLGAVGIFYIFVHTELPHIKEELRREQELYKKSIDEVQKSTDFWSSQTDYFRNRAKQEFLDQSNIYTAIISRQSHDVKESARALEM